MQKPTMNLFASPLMHFQHEDADALNAQLLSEARALREVSEGLKKSNQSGWHSENDLFKRQEPGFKKLCSFISASLQSAERQFATASLSDKMQAVGWVNINGRGAFNTPHSHPGFRWSGCYYVQQPLVEDSRSGSIEFLDPRAGIKGWPLSNMSFGRSKATLKPAAGTLLIFPSYLVHWVYPNEEESERVSIAFNARPIG